MSERYILALDQGTTSSRAALVNGASRIVAMAQKELTQHYPKPGWVEHDPLEIWESQREVMRRVLADSGTSPRQIEAIGITNQRETTILWDRDTGRPVYNAIVWQCRRTAEICNGLKRSGFEPVLRERTGLVADAYFSATKVKWILDEVEGARRKAEQGKVLFGTVDSWLLWNLTGGKVHATDCSNASRTMLYNIREQRWDREICEQLAVPPALLPEVRPSSGVYGAAEPRLFEGRSIPIAGIAGDQQAALFGQACFEPGMAKNTYGTGCFLIMNTGKSLQASSRGLLSTIAWDLGRGVVYALEGSVFIAGAVVQWLRDGLNLLTEAKQSEQAARQVEDAGGVYFVPAFVGLGAPYWDMQARGAILGLTQGVSKNHLIRAALESIAFQTRDVLEAIQADSGLSLGELRADGGAAANDFLMQFQADILGVPVVRPKVVETTALGAAYLAGLAVGFWKNPESIAKAWGLDRRFSPGMPAARREALYTGWKKAVARAMRWEEAPS